jgi:hypothetical protein
MRYEDINPTMRRFIGAREAFRKLGFRAEDLYCLVRKSVKLRGERAVFVLLKAQDKEFLLECGPAPDLDMLEFDKMYGELAEAFNSGQIPQEEVDRIWQESEPYQDKTGFATALLNKGFRFPRSQS